MAEKRLTGAARKLRSNMTDAETALWARLRSGQVDGFKFVRQFPIGPYVADFACRSAKLVIELDGGQHATSETDATRTRLIEAHGYSVIRFWNHDVLANMDGVLEATHAQLLLSRNR
jgi:very-short-patch-repair endonuclease